MLLEIAIGDAYGAGFEFSPRAKITQFNDLTAYHEHELGLSAGRYTDDTQMSLAIAELLIEGHPWSRETIAEKFVTCFKRDVRQGYSAGFFEFLKSINSGNEFLQKINPHSTRNGAAMRSAPIGIIASEDAVLGLAELQASLTHNTEIGIKSAQAVALAAHYFIYKKGSKGSLSEYVSDVTGYHWRDDWNQSVACCGKETVHALLTVLKRSETLTDVLLSSVAFGGDVDTVAAVGLGVASLSHEYETGLPEFLTRDLENGIYGRDYLRQVGMTLMSLKRDDQR